MTMTPAEIVRKGPVRSRQKATQTELAERLSVRKNTIARWEQGGKNRPANGWSGLPPPPGTGSSWMSSKSVRNRGSEERKMGKGRYRRAKFGRWVRRRGSAPEMRQGCPGVSRSRSSAGESASIASIAALSSAGAVGGLQDSRTSKDGLFSRCRVYSPLANGVEFPIANSAVSRGLRHLRRFSLAVRISWEICKALPSLRS